MDQKVETLLFPLFYVYLTHSFIPLLLPITFLNLTELILRLGFDILSEIQVFTRCQDFAYGQMEVVVRDLAVFIVIKPIENFYKFFFWQLNAPNFDEMMEVKRLNETFLC